MPTRIAKYVDPQTMYTAAKESRSKVFEGPGECAPAAIADRSARIEESADIIFSELQYWDEGRLLSRTILVVQSWCRSTRCGGSVYVPLLSI